MTDHLYDQLTPGGKRLARIPRFGRLIARMSQERLKLLTTEASTYWEVFSYVDPQHDIQRTGVIDSGLERGASDLGYVHGDPPINRDDYDIRLWQRNLAMAILGAIAFEMYVRGEERPLDRVEGNLTDFKKAVVNRCVDAGCYIDENGDPINKKNLSRQDWLRIRRLDVTGLQNLLFSNFPSVDENSAGGERILFTDITTQAFFAAYWATRWANEDDRLVMRDWIPDPWLETNKSYNEFWTFAVELPDSAISLSCWQSMFAPLYDRRLQGNQDEPIRSSELIYRSWRRMEGDRAKEYFCNEFASLLNEGNEIAKGLVVTTRSNSQFVLLFLKPRSPRLEFGEVRKPQSDSAGDDSHDYFNEKHCDSDWATTPFLIQRSCVSNLEFELFDSRRIRFRGVPSQWPMVGVCWYDAWCFANWLGEFTVGEIKHHFALPTEAQWECASNASITQRKGPFTAQTVELVKSLHRWIDGVDEIQIPQEIQEEAVFVKMKGFNLWQWCDDHFEPNATELRNGVMTGDRMARVLRGGEWLRRNSRYWARPFERDNDFGFRLAAVPLSQARTDRASEAQARQAE